MKKKEKEEKNIKRRKLKQKINFLLRFHNTAFDVIFVQVIFSMLGASSYNFKKFAVFSFSLLYRSKAPKPIYLLFLTEFHHHKYFWSYETICTTSLLKGT